MSLSFSLLGGKHRTPGYDTIYNHIYQHTMLILASDSTSTCMMLLTRIQLPLMVRHQCKNAYK